MIFLLSSVVIVSININCSSIYDSFPKCSCISHVLCILGINRTYSYISINEFGQFKPVSYSESLYLFCVVSLSLMKISDTCIHGASPTVSNAISSFPPCIRSFKTTKNVSSWLPSLSFLDLVEWEQMQWLKRRLFWRLCSSWRDTLSSAGRIL